MRITRFKNPAGQVLWGADRGDGSAEVLDGSPLAGPAKPTGRVEPIARRLAPLDPVNIFCIGLNYRKHAEETGAELPQWPVVFMKPTTALNHPGSPIVIPAACEHGDEVDAEGELAVVIGRAARDVPEARALDYVLGYTAANDVSARRWQKHAGGGQWVRGKGFDTFCPLGPVLVTADELPDPQTLPIRTTLGGQTMQDSSTADMIFSIAQLIAFLSRDTTLLPGTVILTGTPEGVGAARKPPRFMQPGETVTVAIGSIGELTNPVVSAGPAS